MSMMDCKIHGWWEVNGQDVCPSCEIASLRAEVERLTSDLTLLTDKNVPEPNALHYDECPYKPFADLPRWEEPENPPTCTCSMAHKAAYWKARWMLTAGWRRIAERERDEALAQVALLVELCERVMAAKDPDEYARDLEIMLNGDRIAQARTLLDRLHELERESVITIPPEQRP